jgi:HEPN domain-containing protein
MAQLRATPRRFLRASEKRLEEARFLFDGGYFTAAVYLAGYAVECSLKALILFSEPASRQLATLKTFRGSKAHEFASLLHALKLRKNEPSDEITEAVNEVNWWSTEIRYDPAEMKNPMAAEFISIARQIVDWVKGRMP